MKIVWDNRFKRAFRKIIKKNPEFQDRIINVLYLLENDPFTPSLKSHKLTGSLEGLWSCSAGYDCRIIFTFSQDEDSQESVIVLVDIGSHDEVY
ncbi:plasmid stabilization protein [[Phormidium ambiguum] IAM M-71]|uniref:Plasmid stabilization protein n=1 Tax=[Phormidium ambiguum] IAM M-71 TaxID=454136 RepID=A0A1U7IJN9_9CYAN|nr:type II toxin-antitoxin system mRNA interferase toxin, RelE/StbE family [Phormidium ambiguum]OKH37340.1 plasmid stabilization protein [Phormidium ambiguum IAM M-71]